MALKTFVKVSNITNLSDARYCAGMGVDLLGFNIDTSSEHFVAEKDFSEISEWISGVGLVGEFETSSIEIIKDSLRNYNIDYIQLTDQSLVEKVFLFGKPIIFKITVEEANDIDRLKGQLSYLDELAKIVVLKCTDASLSDTLDEKIEYYNANLKLLKGYRLEIDDQLHKFPGLELEATEEERPGFKDYGKVMDILEAIEDDE